MLKELDAIDGLLWGAFILVCGMYFGVSLGQFIERSKTTPFAYPQPSEKEQRASRAAQRAYLSALDGE